MYLNEAVFDNLESFMKRVAYVSDNTDVNEFTGNYAPDYRFNSDVLNYDAPGYNALTYAECFEELAAKCLCNYNFFKRIFYHSDIIIKPCHLYDLGYYFYLLYKTEAVYEPLSIASANIIKSISFRRIPSEEFDCKESFLSEWGIADIMISIDARISCGIISKLAIDSSHIAELKKFIIRKDKDGFITYIIDNAIDTSVLQMACALIILGNRYKLESKVESLSIEETENMISKTMENPDIELSPGLFSFYHSLLYNPNRIPIENLVSYIHSFEVLKVQMIQHLKHYSSNLDAVNEFEIILQEHPEMNDVRIGYDDVANGILLNIRVPLFEDFKRRFVCETSYPPSVGKAKEPKSCYRYNQKQCRWKEDSIFYLYQRLVDFGFLKWDEETLYSFMYRMCPDYKPEKTDPSPIVWNGDISTLWTLIYHFHGESIKMDNLTRLFFLKKNGAIFNKNDGGKNSTHSKDKQIMEILQDPMFAKS